MPVKGRQQYNLKPIKKVSTAPKEQIIERTSLRSERSSMRSTSSATKTAVDAKRGAKTPPAKKKITPSSLEKAKQAKQVFQTVVSVAE